jgi:hypothetical protein
MSLLAAGNFQSLHARP